MRLDLTRVFLILLLPVGCAQAIPPALAIDTGGQIPDASTANDAGTSEDGAQEDEAGPDANIGSRDSEVAPDSGPTACDAGLSNCRGSCVDLQTDKDNCGACGYAVVLPQERRCERGRPTPGWVPIPTLNGPEGPAFNGQVGFGKVLDNFVFVTTQRTYLLDLSENRWATGPNPPAADHLEAVALPARDLLFVWHAGAGGDATGSFFDGTSWIGASTPGMPVPSTESAISVVASGGEERLVFLNGMASASLSLSSGRWEQIAPFEACDTMAFVATGSVLVGYRGGNSPGFCDAPLRSRDFAQADWTSPDWPGEPGQTIVHSMLAWGGPTHSWVFIAGGWAGGMTIRRGAFAIDPSSWRVVSDTLPAGVGASRAYSAFTGRAVFYWGGATAELGGGTWGGVTSTGAMAQLDSNGNFSWNMLPTQHAPRGRTSALGYARPNTQGIWTGREAIIYGGYESAAAGARPEPQGARYQPPVSCVCPSELGLSSEVARDCATVEASPTARCVP